jgi:hypothetical protein
LAQVLTVTEVVVTTGLAIRLRVAQAAQGWMTARVDARGIGDALRWSRDLARAGLAELLTVADVLVTARRAIFKVLVAAGSGLITLVEGARVAVVAARSGHRLAQARLAGAHRARGWVLAQGAVFQGQVLARAVRATDVGRAWVEVVAGVLLKLTLTRDTGSLSTTSVLEITPGTIGLEVVDTVPDVRVAPAALGAVQLGAFLEGVWDALGQDTGVSHGARIAIGAGAFEALLLDHALDAHAGRAGVAVVRVGLLTLDARALLAGVAAGAGVRIEDTLSAVLGRGVLTGAHALGAARSVLGAAVAIFTGEQGVSGAGHAAHGAVISFTGLAGGRLKTAVIDRAHDAGRRGLTGGHTVVTAAADQARILMGDRRPRDTPSIEDNRVAGHAVRGRAVEGATVDT